MKHTRLSTDAIVSLFGLPAIGQAAVIQAVFTGTGDYRITEYSGYLTDGEEVRTSGSITAISPACPSPLPCAMTRHCRKWC